MLRKIKNNVLERKQAIVDCKDATGAIEAHFRAPEIVSQAGSDYSFTAPVSEDT